MSYQHMPLSWARLPLLLGMLAAVSHGAPACAPLLASSAARGHTGRSNGQTICERRLPGESWPQMARRLRLPLRLLLQDQQPESRQACLPIATRQQTSPSPTLMTGRLQQLSWPIQGILTSAYGFRSGKMHTGIDIGASKGQLIRSAATGTIVRANYHPTYGNVVVVLHPSGFRTLYAHQDRILVRLGQQVRRGDVIGKIGATGRATGPHLHFEVHQSDGPVDPLPYLLGHPVRQTTWQRAAR